MAKSSRSSAKKHNNQRLATNVFGPAESARAERLSQRLLEIAKQPKPESSDVNMDTEGKHYSLSCWTSLTLCTVPAEDDAQEEKAPADENSMLLPLLIILHYMHTTNPRSAMEVDSTSKPSKARMNKKGIVKRRSKKSGIVFPKYGDRIAKKKKGGK